MIADTAPAVDRNRLVFSARAFLFDASFPNAKFWRKLLRPGSPVGRLFYAPESAKLSTAEIREALAENRIKLPQTISIDRNGSVFLTPHRVRYTLDPRLERHDFERLVNGDSSRYYLDKVQVRHDAPMLTIAPKSGVLTSCSMYLREHFVFLNRGRGDFGIHTSAVLLDPVKTFGANVMLEIYNTGDEPVVNPMVSVEIFRAPKPGDGKFKSHAKHRTRLLKSSQTFFKGVDASPPKLSAGQGKTVRRPEVKGQHLQMPNASLLFCSQGGDKLPSLEKRGFANLSEALDKAPQGADSLFIDYFTNLSEHVELIGRLPELKLKRIIFRNPSRTHGFFFSNNAHARFDVYRALGIDVFWYNVAMRDIYLHTYKKENGFFVREELAQKFKEATLFAFYGSAVGLHEGDTQNISNLIGKMTDFIGSNVGILTGGGGGVMRLATEQAREAKMLTGACYLELEAQPPELGVDFFNTFQETSRHNRQKWFQAADFCVFNVGGVGTLEEIGIEMCNLKLGIRARVPYVFFNARYWRDLRKQIYHMIDSGRAPTWMKDYLLFTDDPDEVVDFYRKMLQVL